MADDTLYSTTYEAALSVVATSMKKARQPVVVLVANSIAGGILFTAGGMLFILVMAYCPTLEEDNPGLVKLIQGLVFPIGLIYVVLTGTDLFNSNILYLGVGLFRGAVSIIDAVIIWLVTYWLNLVSTIFVAYIIGHYSHITREESYLKASQQVVVNKASFTFVQSLIKGIAGNFLVCLAVYLQMLAKPIHVRCLMIGLPIFTCVSMGFTHCIADMFLLITGLINHAPIPVRTVAWKVMLPGALGNVIGGLIFSFLIPFYLHIYVVENDQKFLRLPAHGVFDEQPELNVDSRVVRQHQEKNSDGSVENVTLTFNPSDTGADNNSSTASPRHFIPEKDEIIPQADLGNGASDVPSARRPSTTSGMSRFTSATHRSVKRLSKSPKNVFPIYGMSPPGERERSIASGSDSRNDLPNYATEGGNQAALDDNETASAVMIGDKIRNVLSRGFSQSSKPRDVESGHRPLT